MSKSNTADKILLGNGTVKINDIPIGLTRGGSAFTIEREYRAIEADGDFGAVKGRQVIDKEEALLTIKALELFNVEDMPKYYPALKVESVEESEQGKKMMSTLDIKDSDYVKVSWTGKTRDGKAVNVTILNALNLNNLEWTFEDKNEVVPELQFKAHYTEEDRTVTPWNVTFAD